jgi:hypothetical protein
MRASRKTCLRVLGLSCWGLGLGLLPGCAQTGAGPTAPAAPAAAAAPVAGAASLRPLFNGRDLDGWTTVGTAVWKVEDGAIVGGQEGDPKRSGLLTTVETFVDFELSLEFMIDEHGKYNSGVYLRNVPGARDRTGYQVNIGRAAAKEYTGGIYTDRWLATGDETDAVRRPGAWNHLHISAVGPHIVVTLNGTTVADFTDPAPPEGFLAPGVIAFQTYGAEDHSGWVKFRDIRVRPLPAGAAAR